MTKHQATPARPGPYRRELCVSQPVDRSGVKADAAAAELLDLQDHSITGNGRGLTHAKNSGAALQPVLAWLGCQAGETETQGGT